jgi:hypothetical protein
LVGIDCVGDVPGLFLAVSSQVFGIDLRQFVDGDNAVAVVVDTVEYLCEFLSFLLADGPGCEEAFHGGDEVVAALCYSLIT